MPIRLGDFAPDFTQDSTAGPIRFHEWLGGSWGVLFSHPRDFTPVCTTELGEVARLKSEFEKRNVKVIGLSVDPLRDHNGWAADIEETQGQKLNFPLIADGDRSVSLLYDMIHPNASETFTVRSVFVIAPAPTGGLSRQSAVGGRQENATGTYCRRLPTADRRPAFSYNREHANRRIARDRALCVCAGECARTSL